MVNCRKIKKVSCMFDLRFLFRFSLLKLQFQVEMYLFDGVDQLALDQILMSFIEVHYVGNTCMLTFTRPSFKHTSLNFVAVLLSLCKYKHVFIGIILFCEIAGEYLSSTKKLVDQGNTLEKNEDLLSKVLWSIQWSVTTLQYFPFAVCVWPSPLLKCTCYIQCTPDLIWPNMVILKVLIPFTFIFNMSKKCWNLNTFLLILSLLTSL